MSNLLKVLSFAVDILKSIGSIVSKFKKADRKKKDEKEQAELESIFDKSNNSNR